MPFQAARKGRGNFGGNRFIERTLCSLLEVAEQSHHAEALAGNGGLLQRLDARVNVIGLLALIIATAMARNFIVLFCIFILAILLAILSRVPLCALALRAWIEVFVFTGLIALPAIFIAPGRVLYCLPLHKWPVTEDGLRSALYLVTRCETAATLALLLVLCTPWMRVLKALRALHMPVIFVVILGMTYRYIFLLLQTAREMFEARRSRLVGRLDGRASRRLAAASAGVLLGKSLHLSGEVYLAMQARGFRGEVYTLDEFQMRVRDWLALALFLGTTALALWFGRI